MSAEDRSLLEELARLVRAEFADAQIWAYGSRVRGDATQESDFDVCVVIDHVSPSVRGRINDLAWEVGFERDVVVAPVVISREMFDHGPLSVSPLVKTIRSDGVAA